MMSSLSLLILLYSLFSFSDTHSYWDQEVEKATKELKKPKLTKAIIRCYWKSYAVLGVFTLIEVRSDLRLGMMFFFILFFFINHTQSKGSKVPL